MRLKSLKLSGFKSFANPTLFTFKNEITAIVGPNGCGKSNVIDAIRWVLGESSAKQLRGGAMSDVIFAGTQDKAAKSMASVELIFEHTQDEHSGIRHELNLYQELSVRRQINLEGKSDYFINGTRCRRRDVIDVFLGTGLGSRSYAVIEQGMIGRIIDSNPMQLREFIEEGAGISRYQARREETQKKLQQTQENLNRLIDLQSELSKQQKTLEKQASHASHYQELKQKLHEAELTLFLYQLYQTTTTKSQQQAEQQQLEASVKEQSSLVQSLKTKIEKLNQKLSEEQWLKEDAKDIYHQQQIQLQQLQYQLTHLQAQIEQDETRLSTVQQQQQQTDRQITELEAQLISQKHHLELSKQKHEQLVHQKQQHQKQQHPQQHAWHTVQQQLSELQNQKQQLEQQLAINHQIQQTLSQQQQKWQKHHQLWQKDAQTTPDQQIHTLKQQTDDLSKQLNSLSHQQSHIEEQLDDLQPAQQTHLHQLNQTQQHLNELEKKHAILSGEYETLHRLQQQHSPSTATHAQNHQNTDSKKHSNTWQNIINQYPKLRDTIKLTPLGEQHSKILDIWLSIWLESSIYDHDNPQIAAIFTQPIQPPAKPSQKSDTLRSHNHPFSLLKQQNLHTHHSPKPMISHQEGQLIPLTQLIKQPQLTLWENGYVFIPNQNQNLQQDNDTNPAIDFVAMQATLPPSSILLTHTGWIVSDVGQIHLHHFINETSTQDFLTQKIKQTQRLHTLEAELEELEAQIDDTHKQQKQHKARYEEQQRIIEELSAQNKTNHQLYQKCQNELAQIQLEQQQVQQHQERIQQEKNRLMAEQQEHEKQAQEQLAQQTHLTQQLNELKPQLEQAEQQRQHLKHQKSLIEQAQQTYQQQIQAEHLKMKELEIQYQHTQKNHQQAMFAHEQLLKEQQNLQAQITDHQKHLPELTTKKNQSETLCHEQKIRLEEIEAQLTILKTEHQTYQKTLDEASCLLDSKQQKLMALNTEIAILNERHQETQQKINDLKNQHTTATAQNLSPLSIEEQLAQLKQHTNTIAEIKAQIQTHQTRQRTLQQKIENIGAVNLAAVHELNAINERLSPLNQQIEDINHSKKTLENAIDTIDQKTKTLFLDTLNAVNQDLNRLFQKIFGGGQASLSLIEDPNLAKADKWRAGLELIAQPKGKKNSRLAVLSGGEKTLTALSLVFAIFKQHPAPFCVLDEVDAPLDDANVARFTNLITELAQDVQFIFISHNKLAMQTAQELKGITMPTAGISQLVTVSLAEAEKYIEPTNLGS